MSIGKDSWISNKAYIPSPEGIKANSQNLQKMNEKVVKRDNLNKAVGRATFGLLQTGKRQVDNLSKEVTSFSISLKNYSQDLDRKLEQTLKNPNKEKLSELQKELTILKQAVLSTETIYNTHSTSITPLTSEDLAGAKSMAEKMQTKVTVLHQMNELADTEKNFLARINLALAIHKDLLEIVPENEKAELSNLVDQLTIAKEKIEEFSSKLEEARGIKNPIEREAKIADLLNSELNKENNYFDALGKLTHFNPLKYSERFSKELGKKDYGVPGNAYQMDGNLAKVVARLANHKDVAGKMKARHPELADRIGQQIEKNN